MKRFSTTDLLVDLKSLLTLLCQTILGLLSISDVKEDSCTIQNGRDLFIQIGHSVFLGLF